MGRSITPKYRIETTCLGTRDTPCAWNREYGRPTEANLAEWVRRHNASYEPGGCNEHIGKAFGVERCLIVSAQIIRQSDRRVVVTLEHVSRTQARGIDAVDSPLVRSPRA